jgi:tetratricopeptide (TPR) repeat protein
VEHPELSETGSINDIKKRLLLWAKRSPKGLARVEFSSEFSRQKVLEAMRITLAEADITLHEIVLPSQQEAIVVVEKLLEELNQIESVLVSVTGFSTAFTNKIPLEESIRILNFHRDRLVALNLNQIWWMTPAFLQTSIHAMPDINSWFSLRLQLKEMILIDVDSEQHPSIIEPSIGMYTNIDDARRRVHNLLQRFQQGQLAGTPDLELLTTYLLPALKILSDVGAQKELQDLTLQFEGLLGQLQLTNSPELAKSLDLLAGLYHSQGRYSEAEPLYLKALKVGEHQILENKSSVASSLNNLAELYREQGRYSEAEPLYLRVLEILRDLSIDHPNITVTLNNLGILYVSQGKFRESEKFFSEILKNLASQKESRPLIVATCLSSLAYLYKLQGLYSEAESFYLRSLDIVERILGSKHPHVAYILNNLAELYESQKLYSKAEQLYLQSLDILEKQLGTDHPSVIASYNNLAVLYANMNKFQEAEPLLIKALDLNKKILGEQHPNTITTQKSLANVRAKMI